MPRRKTEFFVGAYYHIYNRAVAENKLFHNHDNYLFFLEKIRIYLLPISKILAYCLMPNHFHLLIQLKSDTLSAAMQKLALSYTVPFNKQFDRSGHLFQGRFQARHVVNTQYLVHLSRYIHLNPKTANMVYDPVEWKFSSLAEYYGMRSNKMINTGIILNIISDLEKLSFREKQLRYKKFIESWESEYMVFRQKSK